MAPASRITQTQAPPKPPPVHPVHQALTPTETPATAAGTSAIASTEIRSAAVSPAQSRQLAASASLLSRWLNPRTLRAQFILTEIFQPPLAMREDRH
jgi:hypothetical protein